MMHHSSQGFTFSYVLFVIAIILFIIAVVFAIWYFSLENQDNEKRRNIIDKKNIAVLFFLASLSLTLIAMYSGARTAGLVYATEHSLISQKLQ